MPANQQRAITYSLQGGIPLYVLGTVAGTVADFVLNGATGISLSVDASALAGPTTVTFLVKTTPLDDAKLLGTFIVAAGASETIITFPSFGPLVAYAVQVTANNAGGGDFIVSARAQ
jgi:hypothetical protein